jgi:hypothetical protein
LVELIFRFSAPTGGGIGSVEFREFLRANAIHERKFK